jgi:hypothetical protein
MYGTNKHNMGKQGGDWGGRKIRELLTRDGQTIKQCMMACDVWKFGVHLVMVMEVMISRRERPVIAIIITFWQFFVCHNKEKS